MTYNLQLSAMRTLSRAVRKVIDTILSVGDHDQIAMTMQEVVFHKQVQPFLSSLFGTFFSEEACVGQVLLRGARAISKKVATTKNNGHLNKKCRSLLRVLAIYSTQ